MENFDEAQLEATLTELSIRDAVSVELIRRVLAMPPHTALAS